VGLAAHTPHLWTSNQKDALRRIQIVYARGLKDQGRGMAKIYNLNRKTAAQPQEKQKSTVLIAIETWLSRRPANTKRAYMAAARAWSEYLNTDLETLQATDRWRSAKHEHAQDFLNQYADQPAQAGRASAASADGKVSVKTVAYKATVLKTMYDELIAKGLLEANPFTRSWSDYKGSDGGERRPHERIPAEGVKRLLTWEPTDIHEWRDLAILHLLLGAALRRSELVTIQIDDVLTSEKGSVYLRLRKTKAQKIQRVTLPDWVANTVLKVREQRQEMGAVGTDLLLVRYTKRRGGLPLGGKFVYFVFKEYCERFKVGDFSPHCARATAITRLLDLGCSHREVQELSRHASVQMVERYDKKRTEVDESASKKLSYD